MTLEGQAVRLDAGLVNRHYLKTMASGNIRSCLPFFFAWSVALTALWYGYAFGPVGLGVVMGNCAPALLMAFNDRANWREPMRRADILVYVLIVALFVCGVIASALTQGSAPGATEAFFAQHRPQMALGFWGLYLGIGLYAFLRLRRSARRV